MIHQEIKIRSIVFGCLQPETLDILVGYGYGMNDGGALRRVNRNDVPEDCRMPNTYLWVRLKKGDIIAIEKMNEEEIEANKINSL